jgi:hypothetical protein
MNRTRALPAVLEVLDDGLRLYRRHLAGFTLVATAVLVLLAIFSLSFMAFVRSEIGTSPGWLFLAICVLLLLGYPLLLYAFAALSRATAAALDGQAISLSGALRLSPIRGVGMIFFNVLFSLLAGMFASVMAVVLSCPISYLSILMTAAFSVMSSSSGVSASLGLLGVLSQISTFWSLTVAGAWLASMVYAVQAFVLEQRPWREASSRAIDVLTVRFGYSLLMFLGAGAIFGTLLLSYLGSMLALWIFIQDRLLASLPPLAGDVITIVLIVGSLVILLPPLAIWMAIFYRRQVRERDGEEIARQVADWRAQTLSGS